LLQIASMGGQKGSYRVVESGSITNQAKVLFPVWTGREGESLRSLWKEGGEAERMADTHCWQIEEKTEDMGTFSGFHSGPEVYSPEREIGPSLLLF